jgi:hypothetical protein
MPHFLPPVTRASRRAGLALALTSLVAFALAGCVNQESAQSGAPGGTSIAARIIAPGPGSASPWFELGKHRAHLPYPLAVGNQWYYLVSARTTLTNDQGPQPPVDLQYPWLVMITGVTNGADGRLYYLQSESDPSAIGPGPVGNFFERQDRTGLFELDQSPILLSATGSSSAPVRRTELTSRLIATVEAMPATAAHRDAWRRAALAIGQRLEGALHPAQFGSDAGVPIAPPVGELAMLRYPLYVGASWIVRESPRFERRVTARERLTVPAGQYTAWRIAGSSELFGPNDQATFWYGDSGLLRILVHAEAPATDNSGNVIGTMQFDSDQVLTAANLRGSALLRTSADAADDDN